ncbi:MAG: hypothetical protein V4660_17645 [Pseudomonadota bacterium]
MTVSLIDLPYLIELVSRDIKELNATIENENTPEELRDYCGELLMAALRTAGNLQNQYTSEWTNGCNLPNYNELIIEIERRI